MPQVIERQEVDWAALSDRSVIITGGASGLGEATVEKFAAHGAFVTIADISKERGKALADRLTTQGKHVCFVRCDTTDWESSVAAFKHAANFGPSRSLDVAILYAGLSGPVGSMVDKVLQIELPTLDGSPPLPEPPEAIEVNLKGVRLSVWLALHYFRLPSADGSAGKKSLVIVTSLAAYIDQPYAPNYSASKFGARGLFRAIRSEVHKVNTRVNNIAPGFFLTPLTIRNHGITSPDQPSKALGAILPWAPIDHVVEAAGRCAVDDTVNGRTLGVFPSGFIDMEEDADAENPDTITRLFKTEFLDKIAELNAGAK